MKKKKTILSVASVFLVAVVAIAIVGIATGNSMAGKITYRISVSWEYNHESIEEISQNSDVIALIRVISESDSYQIRSVPLTEFEVEVITPIYGADPGEHLTIVMTGGITASGSFVELDDDPLLRPNEEFLIFARQNDDGTLTMLSGPQGRLVHEEGRLSSITPDNSMAREANQHLNIQIENASFEDIVNEIQNAVATN